MSDKPSAAKTVETTKTPVTPPEQTKGGMQVFPTQAGNELFAIVKFLEALNKNIAFLATTIDKHLNPDRYKKQPGQPLSQPSDQPPESPSPSPSEKNG